MGKSKSRYGVILDAGSSGTRLHVYKWKDPARIQQTADLDDDDLRNLPEIKNKLTKKIRPGISTFGDHPEDVGPEHLKQLVALAVDAVPSDKHADTPIFLMATAGMRLLPKDQQRAVLDQTCTYFRQYTKFSLPDCNLHIQVIPGETEGLYGWIAANYLLGGFEDPYGHFHGKNHHTYGFLDMGGASAQIAFAPNETIAEQHADDLSLLRMRTVDGAPLEYKVFTTTWLGYGVNEARHRYVQRLVDTYHIEGQNEVPDPCMPRGLRTTEDGQLISGVSDELQLVGTGLFDECMRITKPLLGKDMPCSDPPCLVNGQHVPPIDFDVNHFVGVSEYWHTTHGVFAAEDDQAYDFATYQKKVLDFCGREWDDIEYSLESQHKDPAKEAQDACFKASWLINMLHEGLGIPRVGLDPAHESDENVTDMIGEAAKEKGFLDPFQAADEIDGNEVSWVLGKMVLYASGQVPPQSSSNLPVGFGSNVAGIPSDFQYAGSTYNRTQVDDWDDEYDLDDWSDTAEDLIDHAKSKPSSYFFFLILILGLLAFVFRRRERRMRLYTRCNAMFRRRKPGSPKKTGRGLSSLTSKLFGRGSHHYERVLEEGDVPQFELGDVSDDGENSDSSGESRVGRTSGLLTPKTNMDGFDDLAKPTVMLGPGSALNRSGLGLRTESRERLCPPVLNTTGRRSRAGSPTRMKSPRMPPKEED